MLTPTRNGLEKKRDAMLMGSRLKLGTSLVYFEVLKHVEASSRIHRLDLMGLYMGT